MSRHARILLGHGSRDPLWRQPIEAVAQRMQARAPQLLVRCAYLELMAPDLASAVAALSALGATSIGVVPMFLGSGRHVREDLPALVQALRPQYPALDLRLHMAMGEQPAMLELMAKLALQGAD